MALVFSELKRRDHAKAVRFMMVGMNVDAYHDSRFFQTAYGIYFFYSELNRSTQVIAAYEEDRLAGVLLADMEGEHKAHNTLWSRLVIRAAKLFMRRPAPGVSTYWQANEEMFADYKRTHSPDGELVFLAADPAAQNRGIGTQLLQELERREAGKTVYLYTDDQCTYQFYEHRGFERVGERDIVMDMGEKQVPLKCLLYSRKLG